MIWLLIWLSLGILEWLFGYLDWWILVEIGCCWIEVDFVVQEICVEIDVCKQV